MPETLTRRIRTSLIGAVRAATRRCGIELTRYTPPDGYNCHSFLAFSHKNLSKSRSQSLQDLFVQFALRERTGGYFVEFGATDGITISNTLMLEQHYNWKGILAEPARCWQDTLKNNRNCIVDSRCVWDRSGEMLEFNEASEGAFSTVNSYSTCDSHAQRRDGGTLYSVESVSLSDLLKQHKAPSHIDYLSLDTEGSERRILSAFDFSGHEIDVITVEHNYTPDRDAIYSILLEKGYIRKFEAFSLHDDWYVRADLDRSKM